MPPTKKKSKKPRFYADENFFLESVKFLKSKGFNIVHAVEDLDYAGRDDKFHFDQADQNQRIFLTLDPDFLSNTSFPLRKTAGVIIIVVPPKITDSKINAVLTKLILLFRQSGQVFFKHKKVRATSTQITIWELDRSGKVIKEILKY